MIPEFSSDLLLLYSEWLDVQGLIVPPDTVDTRRHEDLVREFLEDE